MDNTNAWSFLVNHILWNLCFPVWIAASSLEIGHRNSGGVHELCSDLSITVSICGLMLSLTDPGRLMTKSMQLYLRKVTLMYNSASTVAKKQDFYGAIQTGGV